MAPGEPGRERAGGRRRRSRRCSASGSRRRWSHAIAPGFAEIPGKTELTVAADARSCSRSCSWWRSRRSRWASSTRATFRRPGGGVRVLQPGLDRRRARAARGGSRRATCEASSRSAGGHAGRDPDARDARDHRHGDRHADRRRPPARSCRCRRSGASASAGGRSLDPRDPGLRQVLRLMGPATIGAAAVQVNVLVNNNFASYLGDGAGLVAERRLPLHAAADRPLRRRDRDGRRCPRCRGTRRAATRRRSRRRSARRSSWSPSSACRRPPGSPSSACPVIGLVYEHGRFSAADTTFAGAGARRLRRRPRRLRRHQGARAGVLRARRHAHADAA